MKRNTVPAVTVAILRDGGRIGSVKGFGPHELDDAAAYVLHCTKLGKCITVTYYTDRKG